MYLSGDGRSPSRGAGQNCPTLLRKPVGESVRNRYYRGLGMFDAMVGRTDKQIFELERWSQQITYQSCEADRTHYL